MMSSLMLMMERGSRSGMPKMRIMEELGLQVREELLW
jgi:hypothetical protein